MSLSAPSAASETAPPATAATPVDTSPTPGSAAPTTGLRRGRPRWVRTFWQPLLVLVALVGLWYAAAYYYDQVQQLGYLVPYPHLVLQALFVDANSRATILTALMNSAMVALTGLVIAVVLGVAWAVLMSQAKWVERSLFPYAVILQCVPVLALVPLIGMLFGFDFSARVIVTVMIALFPMVANTLFGLQSADRAQRELFQLQGASRFTRLVKLPVPGRPAVDLPRPAQLRRPVGHRRDRRRPVLPARHAGHRGRDPDLRLPPLGARALRRDPHRRPVRRGRLPPVRPAHPARRRSLVRPRLTRHPPDPHLRHASIPPCPDPR